MSKIYKNKKLFALLIALFCFSIISIVIWTNVFEIFQLKISDRLYSPSTPTDDIIIIKIDDKSTDEQVGLGHTISWSRSYYTDVIEAINSYNPKLIVFDISFVSNKDEENDLIFVETVKNSNNILLSQYFKNTTLEENLYKSYSKLPLIEGLENLDQSYFVSVESFLDKDNVFRRYIPGVFEHESGIFYPSFAFSVAERLGINTKKIPLEKDSMLINYFSKPLDLEYQYNFISFIDVFYKKFKSSPESLFKDKIVLIGPTAEYYSDDFLSPVSHNYKIDGIEIHANAIQTILDGKFLRNVTDFEKIITVLIVCLLSTFIFMYLKIRWAILYLILSSTIYSFFTPVLFNLGIIPDVIHPYIALVSTFIFIFIYRYLTEFREKTVIRNAFSKYVSPEIVNKIANNPNLLKLGGESKNITVLFTDIVSFTSISENLKPESLVSLLNEYFSCMIEVIKDLDGTIDKLQGDSIMAFFGAPLDIENAEVKACEACIQMRIRLNNLISEWEKFPLLPGGEKRPNIDFRCGVNTGQAIVGNIGSIDRFDYTVIGDTVNLASRLEGANKKYGTNIIISESTYEKSKNDFVFRELDLIAVVGKKDPTKIYELIGKIDLVPSEYKTLIINFNKGVTLYREKRFDEAQSFFTDILKIYPYDNPSKLYLQRCEVLKNIQPPDDWNGIFKMSQK